MDQRGLVLADFLELDRRVLADELLQGRRVAVRDRPKKKIKKRGNQKFGKGDFGATLPARATAETLEEQPTRSVPSPLVMRPKTIR